MVFEFDSLEDALEIAADRSVMDTPAWRDAVAYILENAPPDLQQQLREGLDRFFPTLKPEFVDEDGQRYYSVEKLQKELGMTDEEMAEALEDMQLRRAERGGKANKPLHRIQ